MGDADGTQFIIPVEDIENWMDEARSETEDGLSSIEMDGSLALMRALNRRTHKIASEMASEIASWRQLKECFTAVNIFVVPVVLAIWIACACNEYSGLDNPKDGFLSVLLQAIAVILMFVSGVIGLPLYLCKILQFYYLENNQTTTIQSRDAEEYFEGDETLTREIADSLSVIGRMTNCRFNDSTRQDIDASVDQSTSQVEETRDGSFESLGFRSEIFDTSKVGEFQLPEQQQRGREDSDFDDSSVVEREVGDCCGLKLTILSNRPDLTVEIEGEKTGTNHHHHQHQSTVSNKPVRNIQVESIGL